MKYYNEGKTMLNCFYGMTSTKKYFYESYIKIHALYSIMKTIHEITEKSDIPYIDTDAVFVREEQTNEIY